MDGLSLEGRVAVVTGGAGAIGAAICRDLASLGAQVIVADIDVERARAVAGELPLGPGRSRDGLGAGHAAGGQDHRRQAGPRPDQDDPGHDHGGQAGLGQIRGGPGHGHGQNYGEDQSQGHGEDQGRVQAAGHDQEPGHTAGQDQGHGQSYGEDHGRVQAAGHEQERGYAAGRDQAHGRAAGQDQGHGQSYGKDQGRVQVAGKGRGHGHGAVEVDLGDDRSIAAFAATVAERFGAVDVLVNNAGITRVEPFAESDPSTWDRQWQINLKAPMLLTQALVGGMVERGWGRVVFVSSDGARVGAGGEAVYAACKAGLLGFAKSLAREVARGQVTSNVVCPGPTDTPMLREVAAEKPRMVESLTRAIPLRRLGAPEDIAATVAFLCSDRAGYLTGQTVSVSGGITMI